MRAARTSATAEAGTSCSRRVASCSAQRAGLEASAERELSASSCARTAWRSSSTLETPLTCSRTQASLAISPSARPLSASTPATP